MGAVLRREFSSFFKSPIGYVFLAAYYLIARTPFLCNGSKLHHANQLYILLFVLCFLYFAAHPHDEIVQRREKAKNRSASADLTGYADKPRLRQIFCNFLHLRHRRWNHSCIFPDSCGV